MEEKNFNCGQACVSMCLKYFAIKYENLPALLSVTEILDFFKKTGLQVSYWHGERHARLYDFQEKVLKNQKWVIRECAKKLKHNNLIICLVKKKRGAHVVNHFVLVNASEEDETGKVLGFYIVDPDESHIEKTFFALDKFLSLWCGVVIFVRAC
jgi:hypothetical protein